MSSAGHIFDMINRFNNNRKSKEANLARFAKVKEAYRKVENVYPGFVDRQKLSPVELEKFRKKVKREMIRTTQWQIIISALVGLLTVGFFVHLLTR